MNQNFPISIQFLSRIKIEYFLLFGPSIIGSKDHLNSLNHHDYLPLLWALDP